MLAEIWESLRIVGLIPTIIAVLFLLPNIAVPKLFLEAMLHAGVVVIGLALMLYGGYWNSGFRNVAVLASVFALAFVFPEAVLRAVFLYASDEQRRRRLVVIRFLFGASVTVPVLVLAALRVPELLSWREPPLPNSIAFVVGFVMILGFKIVARRLWDRTPGSSGFLGRASF